MSVYIHTNVHIKKPHNQAHVHMAFMLESMPSLSYIYICMYTYIHIHTHTNTHTYGIHAEVNALFVIYTLYTYMHTYAHTYMHTYIHIRTHTNTQTHDSYAGIHTYTHTHMTVMLASRFSFGRRNLKMHQTIPAQKEKSLSEFSPPRRLLSQVRACMYDSSLSAYACKGHRCVCTKGEVFIGLCPPERLWERVLVFMYGSSTVPLCTYIHTHTYIHTYIHTYMQVLSTGRRSTMHTILHRVCFCRILRRFESQSMTHQQRVGLGKESNNVCLHVYVFAHTRMFAGSLRQAHRWLVLPIAKWLRLLNGF
jgi:hypothetical protein